VNHGLEVGERAAVELSHAGALAACSRGLRWLEERLLALSSLALLGAAVVLTGSVATRYVFKVPTDWQDEASVFLIVGATFLSGAYVQSQRGHVGIAALAALLPPRVERWRVIVADLVSLLFCAFFSWKSWTLLHEAVAEGQTTSSTWAPPLWIPYGLMAAGMTLLALRLLLQLLTHFASREAAR
jgi:TRAP-type C4-dicarboxylate transport system permease small subunit